MAECDLCVHCRDELAKTKKQLVTMCDVVVLMFVLGLILAAFAYRVGKGS